MVTRGSSPAAAQRERGWTCREVGPQSEVVVPKLRNTVLRGYISVFEFFKNIYLANYCLSLTRLF